MRKQRIVLEDNAHAALVRGDIENAVTAYPDRTQIGRLEIRQ